MEVREKFFLKINHLTLNIMENPIYESPLHNQNQNQGFVFFLAGAENKSVSINQRRTVMMLAISSISVAVLFALAFGWVIMAHSDNMILATCTALLVLASLVLINRSIFLFHKKASKTTIIAGLVYFFLYLTLSFWIIPQPMSYHFLLPQILKERTSNTLIGEFGAMVRVIVALKSEELTALNQYKLMCCGIATIFSLMPLLINFFISASEDNQMQLKQDYMRKQLQELLLQKKLEYSMLFSDDGKPKTNSDDPFSLEIDNPTLSSQERFEKAESLLNQINHIQLTLQHLI